LKGSSARQRCAHAQSARSGPNYHRKLVENSGGLKRGGGGGEKGKGKRGWRRGEEKGAM